MAADACDKYKQYSLKGHDEAVVARPQIYVQI